MRKRFDDETEYNRPKKSKDKDKNPWKNERKKKEKFFDEEDTDNKSPKRG